MASRIFSRRLQIFRQSSTAAPSLPSSSSVLLQRRLRSAEADAIESNIDPSSAAAKPDQLSPLFTVLEDLIHGMIVQRCEPAWQPFVPGSSFWVPPRPQSGTFIRAVEKFFEVTRTLSDEETMALTTMRGWPSSAFFLHGKGVDLEKVSKGEVVYKDFCLTDSLASEDMEK